MLWQQFREKDNLENYCVLFRVETGKTVKYWGGLEWIEFNVAWHSFKYWQKNTYLKIKRMKRPRYVQYWPFVSLKSARYRSHSMSFETIVFIKKAFSSRTLFMDPWFLLLKSTAIKTEQRRVKFRQLTGVNSDTVLKKSFCCPFRSRTSSRVWTL